MSPFGFVLILDHKRLTGRRRSGLGETRIQHYEKCDQQQELFHSPTSEIEIFRKRNLEEPFLNA